MDTSPSGEAFGPAPVLDRKLVRSLHRLSDVRAAVHFTGAISLFGGTAAVVLGWPGTTAAFVAAIALGVLQTGWADAMHCAVHKATFRSARLNTLVGHLGAFVYGWPLNFYRDFHIGHHRHTGDPQRDPELLLGTDTVRDPRPVRQLWRMAVAARGMSVWHPRLLFRCALRPSEAHRLETPYIRPESYRRMCTEARWMLAGYLSIAIAVSLTSPWALAYVPLIAFARSFDTMYAALPEHVDLHQPGASELDRTRSTTSNALYRFVKFNGSYHAEHHAFPGVPFYRLPALRNVMGSQVRHRARGYLRFYFGPRTSAEPIPRDLAGSNSSPSQPLPRSQPERRAQHSMCSSVFRHGRHDF